MRKILFCVIAFFVLAVQSATCAPDARELFNQGNARYQQGEYYKAIEAYEEAIRVDPNFAEAYNSLGMAYRAVDMDLSEVAWYFKTAIDINPNFAEAYDNLSKAYYGLGYFDQAEEYAKAALAIKPRLVSAQYSLAWIYLLGKSQPEDAIVYFQKILDLRPIPFAYYGLGLAYAMADRHALALEVITNLRSMDQDKLATQLEDIVRGHAYVPRDVGPLVTAPPPTEKAEDVIVPAEISKRRQLQEHVEEEKDQASIDLGGQIMKIRLRGTMTDGSAAPKQE